MRGAWAKSAARKQPKAPRKKRNVDVDKLIREMRLSERLDKALKQQQREMGSVSVVFMRKVALHEARLLGINPMEAQAAVNNLLRQEGLIT